ncbi:MAG: MFS transporter, partial [Anaerolineae bacterium]
MDAPVTQVLHRGLDWWRRQKHNYRVAVTRSASQGFLLSLTSQYNSIYTVGLGADSMQLGTVNSVGGAISSLISLPIGWLADRYGIKLLQMSGIALMGGCALIFGLAQSWQAIIAATILASISMRLIGTGCSVICASSVGTKDRVTAQNVCVTANSLLSMVAPLLAAYLVTRFGGMTVDLWVPEGYVFYG